MSLLKTKKIKNAKYNIVFFDTESKVEIDITAENINEVLSGNTVVKHHEIYLIVAEYYLKSPIPSVYTGDKLCFNFWADCVKLTSKARPTLIFAHNAKYDVLVSQAIPQLISLGWKVKMFSESNPFFMFFEKDDKEIRIISSTNYYTMSLAKLGKCFGLIKGEIDYSKNDTGKEVEYCKQDVKILRVAMVAYMEFLKKEKLGDICITLAGQSFQAYLTRFYKGNILLDHNKESVILEREAYCGGRCEAWHIGEVLEELYYLDVNSMYPFVMRNHLYPSKRISYRKKVKLSDMKELLKDNLVISRCKVNTPHPVYPKKIDGKLCFPIGEFTTTLCTPEIEYALSKGHLVEILETNIYKPADLFSEYIDFFYGERLKAKDIDDEVHSLLYKLFLNCLYGKFGQREQNYDVIGQAPETEIRHMNIRDKEHGNKRIRVFGGNIFEKKTKPIGEDEAKNSFCGIAAHVTAYARMLLWGYIENAGFENVKYMDTDSLFLTLSAYLNLVKSGDINEKRLGALKLEDKIETCIINGCKDYVINDKVKLKGVTTSSKKIAENKYISAVWHGLPTFLKSGDLSKYHNTLMLKTLKRQYTKGQVTSTGKVVPFELKE